MNTKEASLVTMLLAGPVGSFLHNSQLSVFRHEIQGLINGCGATKVSGVVSKTDISEAFQAFWFAKFSCSEVYFLSSSMFNSFGIPSMQGAIPFLLMIKIHLHCGVHLIPFAKTIGAPALMFTSSVAQPHSSSNKLFTGPLSYATGLQVPAHLPSQCFENTMVTTWLSGYSSEHLCRYCPVALTAGFDSKVENNQFFIRSLNIRTSTGLIHLAGRLAG